MRWTKAEYNLGDVRFIERFLLFPKTIEKETRWLEYAVIKQVYTNAGSGPGWFDLNWDEKGLRQEVRS